MAESTIWWLLTGGAIAVELVTGTFFLLMLAIGLAAGALAAHAGASLSTQLIVAALIGGGAVVGWGIQRRRQPAGPPAQSNRDVNMDVGELVQVDHWNPDGTATVRYRGASWAVSHGGAAPAVAGPHRVREVVGNRLIVEKI